MGNMKRVYICHPFANNPEGNIEKVRAIVEDLGKLENEDLNKGDESFNNLKDSVFGEYASILGSSCTFKSVLPLSAFTSFPASMSEPVVTRRVAMLHCLNLLSGCDELWVYSRDVSSGMSEEIEYASRNNIPVVWKV